MFFAKVNNKTLLNPVLNDDETVEVSLLTSPINQLFEVFEAGSDHRGRKCSHQVSPLSQL
jgi:hypothetical protein